MGFEAKIIYFLQAGANDGWAVFFKLISMLGSWAGIAIVCILLFWVNRRYSITCGLTYIVSLCFNFGLKEVIARPRPFETYSAILKLEDVFSRSMPSGHATAAAIIASFICYYVFRTTKNKWIRTASVFALGLYLALVCLSRMYLGVHYLSDVVVGVIVGISCAIIGIVMYNKLEKKNL